MARLFFFWFSRRRRAAEPQRFINFLDAGRSSVCAVAHARRENIGASSEPTMVGLLLSCAVMDDEIKEEFAAVRVDLRNIEARVQKVETRVGEEAIATRRHFDVVAESLRDDIRIIAEGLITLDAKVEAMRKI